MKIFQIFNNMCYYDMTPLYTSLEEAKSHYSSEIMIVEAPDYVFESWGYDDTKTGDDCFIKPIAPKGWEYDETTGTFYNLTEQKNYEIRQQIEELKIELSSTDYKIIKCSEYQLAGLDAPYDITTLHVERQALRDQINELETQLAAAEAELGEKEQSEENA